MNLLARQNIEVFAHYLYRLEGNPRGRAEEHWARAEKMLNENLFRDAFASHDLGRAKTYKWIR
jgi:hypothetical protein